MRHLCCLVVVWALWPLMAVAQSDDRVARLYAAMQLPELVAVMRVEGLEYGSEIAETLLAGRGGPAWLDAIETVYAPEPLNAALLAELQARLDPAMLDALLRYYETGPGQTIAMLELEARQILLSSEAEAEARNLLNYMREESDPRLDLLDAFTELNHLVDRNVSGALNSSYEFSFGLIDSGAMALEMTEDDVLRDVWSQESDVRAEIEDWLWVYQLLAYEPLSDAELRAYTDFTQTAEGRALMAALFDSFDVVFRAISRQLGLAAGQQIVSEDI